MHFSQSSLAGSSSCVGSTLRDASSSLSRESVVKAVSCLVTIHVSQIAV